jgi:hypothetical protein
MKKTLLNLVLASAVMGFSVSALADWDQPSPLTKWVQMPDLVEGMDVLGTFNTQVPSQLPPPNPQFLIVNAMLADDFKCTETGPITDLHIWGSWLNNAADPGAIFHLSIHSDVPAGTGGIPYSRPGAVLASVDLPMGLYPGATARIWKSGVNELFYDPNTKKVLGGSTDLWQYNFNLRLLPALFIQQGTPQNPTIYWVDVQVNSPAGKTFGWKTSATQNLDDAVYGVNQAFGGPLFANWTDLKFGQPGQEVSRDLAFVVEMPEPGTWALAMLGGGLWLALRWRRS